MATSPNMIDYGKDKVIFVTKEEHAMPSAVELPPSEPAAGLILESGEINWNCPCLGGMATGPCGVEFRDAFSCFHYSEETPKGTECYEIFKTMQDCFSQYPAVYNKTGGDDDSDLDAVMADSSSENPSNVESVDQDESSSAGTTPAGEPKSAEKS